ncbi:Piwi domain-containing protein [Aequorivita nionensis]|uniref:Piwi domain-containing protein n=1 Tax=Aequorivita nionensis TaxID=1287690 RepID=UPI003965C1CE
MNGQDLKINIIPFSPVQQYVDMSFFKEKRANALPLHLSECPLEIAETYSTEERKKTHYFYTFFSDDADADLNIQIDLSKSPRFAKHYFSHLIRKHFRQKAALVSNNFIRDIEVWFESPNQPSKLFTTYQVFSLRVQYAEISEGFELVIYDNGITRLLNKSINDLPDIDLDTFTAVVFRKNFYHVKNLSDEGKSNYQEVFPVVNKSLETHFGFKPTNNPYGNKYDRKWKSLNTFLSDHINTTDFKTVLNHSITDFMRVPSSKIHTTKKSSSLLQLGTEEKQKVYTPKENLQEFGPYSLPKKNQVKFIMILHENDRDYANRLVQIMKKRYQRPDGSFMEDKFGVSLYDIIRIRFELDRENSILFTDEMNPFDAIQEYLDNHPIDNEKFNYVAIYLSPFSKNETDKEKRAVYYKVKKTLIEHDITSQAIYKEHIFSPDFKKFYYINIAAAILAKTGGVPWKLEATERDELVVGVGAFKSKEFGVPYIGSAFCFSNNGDFKEFNCRSSAESFLLAQEIKIMIQDFIKKKQKLNRLIIHFYKDMGRKEILPIKKVLFQLGYDHIPIIVITVNKTYSKDYLVFDTNFEELLPYSGTIINYARNKYLLFNNTRYVDEEEIEIESYHSPLKLTFQSTHPEALKDVTVIKELIDQIYQFSRMYWKSVKQQNLPVTVKYPEMVAKIYPYFEMEDLNEFGRSNLWFL